MSDPEKLKAVRPANFQAWEDAVVHDRKTQQERIATELLLAAIGLTESFKDKILLKGGILVGAVYQSGRNTADIDFSTTAEPHKNFLAVLEKELADSLPLAAAKIGAPNLILKIQTVKYRPKDTVFEAAIAPAVEIKFAFANRGEESEKKLISGKSNNIIYADISFNEEILCIEEIAIGDSGLSFFAYSKHDLVAEKLRAILQQKLRKRNRRQDVYDLWFITQNHDFTDYDKQKIKIALIKKCQSRNIEPTNASLEDPEIIERSREDWLTLKNEVEFLPEFDDAFSAVKQFYSQLW
ncbi:nucleotidyl transferase AbiEii/AbiGii toxin family protein [Sphingorhabdus lutea]|uniref:nucleotidyl transferase AbiEii/AbiGii toxin family protein n=1 Tax=Sphingorhabdus lutea TaxID=1913578 RepID=UPI0009FB83F9|nr:nucleotidyl transferase AbiEii/AbiGii toxin family protein [Sphingorhabdus lutea]